MKDKDGYICDKLNCDKKATRFFGVGKLISFCHDHADDWSNYMFGTKQRNKMFSTLIKDGIKSNKEHWENIRTKWRRT